MLSQTPKVDPAGLQTHDRFDEVFERTTQAIEPPDHNSITRTRKVEHRLKLGTIIPHSTHHISVGSFDGGFRQRILPRARWFAHLWRCASIQSALYHFLSFLFFIMVLIRL